MARDKLASSWIWSTNVFGHCSQVRNLPQQVYLYIPWQEDQKIEIVKYAADHQL